VRVDKSKWEAMRKVLQEIYEVRSKVEHQIGWDAAFQDYQPRDREPIAQTRILQAEALALGIYRGLTTSPSWRAIFESDHSIEHFWKLGDHERRQRVSGYLDLLSIKWTGAIDA
jgi:hypothetical protein